MTGEKMRIGRSGGSFFLWTMLAAFAFDGECRGDALPVTDGLTVWLDASDDANLRLNDDGQVTNWVNRAPGGGDFVSTGIPSGYAAPYWSSSELGEHGAVVFGYLPSGENAHTMLATSGTLVSRTIFIVTELLSSGVHTTEGRIYGNYSGSDAIMKETSASSYKWYKKGFGEQAWLNGVKKIDVANGLNPNNFAVVADTVHLITAVRSSSINDRTQLGRGPRNTHDWCGPVGEVIAFDRQLLPGERIAIENYLLAKWTGVVKRVWNGGDGDWSVAANWTPEGVPADGEIVDIPSGTVTVTGAVSALSLTVEGGLTLAAGAHLAIDRGGILGSASLTLRDGSYLNVENDFSCDAAGAQTFTYAGTAAVGCGWYGRFILPATVNANGRLLKRGQGRLVFSADGPASGAYDIVAGGSAVDFAGRNLKFSSLLGESFATNTASDATASLNFSVAGGECALATALPAGVDFAKNGAGTLAVSGGSLVNAGEIKVNAGALKAGARRMPLSREGLVCHIDAADASSYTIGVDGSVKLISSHTGNNRSFSHYNESLSNLGHVRIKSDAINGMPAFAFGSCAQALGDAKSRTCYRSNAALKSRTVVAVVKSVSGMGFSATPVLYGVWGGSGSRALAVCRSSLWDLECFCAYGSSLSNGFCSVDGKVIYDYNNGVTAQTTVSINAGSPQLLFMTACDSGVPETGICIGANQDGASQCWSGYIGELLVFNRILEADERGLIEAELMAKWGIECAAEDHAPVADTLRPANAISFAAGTTLDLGGHAQSGVTLVAGGPISVENGSLAADGVTVVCGSDGSYGTIAGDAGFDLTGAAFSFSGGKPEPGVVLKTSGTVVGPFASAPPGLRYKPHSVRYGALGMLMLVK